MRVIEALRRNPKPYGIAVEGGEGKFVFTFGSRRINRPTFANLVDEELFFEQQASRVAQGLDREVVSIWSEIPGYELPPDQGAAWCRLFNEELSRFISDHPKPLSLVGLGLAPLQSGERGARELEHAVQNCGLKGVLITANPPEVPLDGEDLEPFWSCAEELGATLFVHPAVGCVPGLDQPYSLGNVVGVPTETTFTAARMVASGLLDRHPRLNVLLAHGGGFLPYQIGRLGYLVNKDRSKGTLGFRCQRPVTEYLQMFYYDTLLYDSENLRRLAERVGSRQLLAGSDFPFPTYDDQLLETVRGAGLSPQETDDVLYWNAVRLLELPA